MNKIEKLFNCCDGTSIENPVEYYSKLIENTHFVIEYHNVAAKKKSIGIHDCKYHHNDKMMNVLKKSEIDELQVIHLDDFSFYYTEAFNSAFNILHIHNGNSEDTAYYIFDSDHNILVQLKFNYNYYINDHQWFYCDNEYDDIFDKLLEFDFENIFCNDVNEEGYDEYTATIKDKILSIFEVKE